MILSGQPLASAPIACDGLLVIGDPHVSSRRPGRRKEADWPAPVLAKLEACLAVANTRNLMPVVLGDLFERAVEPDESLKARLIRILKQFRFRPLVNVGNHDIAHTTLSDADTLAVFGLSDVVDVVAASGPVCDIAVAGRRLGLGMTPYGQAIPTDVRDAFPGADVVAWFTHHDIAFDASYPGAVAPFPVAGAALVVNGHVHATKRPVRAGETVWHNPGNITRQSVDLIAHVPSAWILDAGCGMERHVLPHAGDVFDLTGRLVAPAPGGETATDLESAFVSLLEAESVTDLARSHDGTLIREEIEAKFARDETPADIRATIRSLLAEAVGRRA